MRRILTDGSELDDDRARLDHRGRGLGVALVRETVESQPNWRWLLHTADAHGLYRKLGFAEPPDTLMERPRPGVR